MTARRRPTQRRAKTAQPATPTPPAERGDELAGPPPLRERCSRKTAQGKRCKLLALPGADICHVHAGAPVGRPTKLDETAIERMVQILQVGGYPEAAAATAGISKQTFYEWLKRGDPASTTAEDAPYREFRKRIELARAEAETRAVAQIARAAAKDWKAAAWMLEREFPDRWAGPRGRRMDSSIHPDDFAAGEGSSGQQVLDDQMGPDGRPL